MTLKLRRQQTELLVFVLLLSDGAGPDGVGHQAGLGLTLTLWPVLGGGTALGRTGLHVTELHFGAMTMLTQLPRSVLEWASVWLAPGQGPGLGFYLVKV